MIRRGAILIQPTRRRSRAYYWEDVYLIFKCNSKFGYSYGRSSVGARHRGGVFMVFFDFFQNRILTVGPWQMGIVFLRSKNHAWSMVGHPWGMVGAGPAKTIAKFYAAPGSAKIVMSSTDRRQHLDSADQALSGLSSYISLISLSAAGIRQGLV